MSKRIKPGDVVNCPTCGGAVQVVADPDGEGTNHYEPVAADLRVELDRVTTELAQCQRRLKEGL